MHFLSSLLEDYIADHSEPEPELLRQLSRETHLKVLRPRMMTGHFQGRVLALLSKIIAPEYILEIGTYTGYSALCLAEGLQREGELHTLEVNVELQKIQRSYFDKSDYGHQICQHIRDARKINAKLERTFDLVCIDTHKSDYDADFEAVIQKTRPGGVSLSENVLWSGKVVEPV